MFAVAGLTSAYIATGQNNSTEIYKGNELYRKQDFDKALEEYQQALKKNANDPVANFNAGNASFRKNNMDEATKYYDNTFIAAGNKDNQQRAVYNKGLAFAKEQKLEEAINTWKQALKLKADDKETRENLEKALRELKKKQQEQSKNQQQKKQQQQQNPPPNKLSPQRVEQLLKALQQQEKSVNDKLNQMKVAAPSRPEKDW